MVRNRHAVTVADMRQARPFLIAGSVTGAIMVAISFAIEDDLQARSTVVTGLIVAVTIAAIPIYSIESWSLTKRSFVHFLVMVATVFPLLLISGWFTLPITIGVFLLFGVAGWTIGYVVSRVQEGKRRE